MGTIDVSNWSPSKVAAAVERIDKAATITLTWTPPASTPTESDADAVRRLQLVRQSLKG